MSKIKLVMIEDNEDLCDIVQSYIQTRRDDLFDIVGVAHDGKNGCKLVFEKMPDIVLIDIVLPVHSGLSILKQIKQNPLTKHIICIIASHVNSETVLSQALELGADYYMVKPFEIDNLIERMIYLYTFASEKDTSFDIENNKKDFIPSLSADDFALYALQSTGIPMNLNGYAYLRSAIGMCISAPGLLDAVTKELYAKVGAEFQTTGSRVERSIRNAIEHAWMEDAGVRYYAFISGAPKDDDAERPSNSKFISSLVSLYGKRHKNS